MGTRHLIAAQIDGEYKIAQYGQWDGYPEGQGLDVLAFLAGTVPDEARLEAFKARLRACRWITEEEETAINSRAGIKPEEEWITSSQAERRKKIAPQLSRDTGAAILSLVAESENGLSLQDELSFAGDSLFCEWAYVIDFDAGQFEVYRGFNQEPTGDDTRFPSSKFGEGEWRKKEGQAREYHPVKLAASWPLTAPPTQDEFLATLKDPEEADGH
jgi:hypothetical protein